MCEKERPRISVTNALLPIPPRVADVQKWYNPEGATEIGRRTRDGVLKDSEKRPVNEWDFVNQPLCIDTKL